MKIIKTLKLEYKTIIHPVKLYIIGYGNGSVYNYG